MINKIIKLSFVLILFIGLSGCDSTDDNTSFLNDRTPVAFLAPGTATTILIKEGQTGYFRIAVHVSEPQPQARAFTYSINPNSTAVEGLDFDLSSTMSIPANSQYGYIEVTAGYENSSLDGKLLVLDLISVEGAELGTRTQFRVTIFRVCPLEAPFTGTYLLQQLSGGIPAAGGAPAFGSGIMVEVYIPDESEGAPETERRFNVKCYPDFGFSNAPVPIAFSLICGNANTIANLQASGVGCGSSIAFGPAENPGMFDTTDDSVIELSFAEDVANSCGGTVDGLIRLTKQ